MLWDHISAGSAGDMWLRRSGNSLEERLLAALWGDEKETEPLCRRMSQHSSLSLSMFLSLAPLGCTSSSHFIYFSVLRFLPTSPPSSPWNSQITTIITTYSSFNCSSSFTKAVKHSSFSAKVALNALKTFLYLSDGARKEHLLPKMWLFHTREFYICVVVCASLTGLSWEKAMSRIWLHQSEFIDILIKVLWQMWVTLFPQVTSTVLLLLIDLLINLQDTDTGFLGLMPSKRILDISNLTFREKSQQFLGGGGYFWQKARHFL